MCQRRTKYHHHHKYLLLSIHCRGFNNFIYWWRWNVFEFNPLQQKFKKICDFSYIHLHKESLLACKKIKCFIKLLLATITLQNNPSISTHSSSFHCSQQLFLTWLVEHNAHTITACSSCSSWPMDVHIKILNQKHGCCYMYFPVTNLYHFVVFNVYYLKVKYTWIGFVVFWIPDFDE